MPTLHEGIQAGTHHATPRSSRPGPPGSMRAPTPTARDIMTDRITCLRVDQSIAEAIQVLVTKGISGAPVQDHAGHLVGMLSELDCMQLVTSCAYHQGESAQLRRVDEFMSTTLYKVPPSADVFTIAQIFMEHRIRRVLVSDGPQLVGLVSRRDLLRALSVHFC